MADLPFPISGKDVTTVLQQMQRLMDELYQNRVAGAELGDVFEIGSDDILALKLSATGGLQKVSNALSVLVDPLDALKSTVAGLGIDNATATKHGALPILSDVATEFLNGKGLWIAALSAALYDANTIIKADVDDTPVALTVAAEALIGRTAAVDAGVITDLTPAQVRTMLGIATGDTVVFGAIKSDNYQNAAGTESLVWVPGDTWWEFSDDVRIAGTAIVNGLKVGNVTEWTLAESIADDAEVYLPTITANYSGHGFIQVSSGGTIAESAEFEIDSTGNAQLIRATANVVVNADTDGKMCIGTAAAQNPMVIKDRLGAGTRYHMVTLWYH